MSGSLNPLAAQDGGQPQAPTPNPLASGTLPAPQPQQGAPPVGAVTAQLAQAQPNHQALIQGISKMDYVTAELARLAGNPNVNRKDVVRATADAVGARKIGAEEGITFISQMPEKPDQVRPWIQQQYHKSLVEAVALKAHAHQMVNAAAQGGAAPGPGVPGGTA